MTNDDVPPLPSTFRLRADPGLAVLQDGRVLLGGAPYRLIRLSERAAPLVDGWISGKPVGGGRAPGLLARRLVDAGMLHPVPVPVVGPAPEVTVVIPVRDRALQLTRCLAGLTAQDGHMRVLVVDDGSLEPEAVARVASAAGAELVRHRTNRGPAAARNTGLELASTELVAFVDSDCVPDPDWLAALLPHFSDPAVAAVAPRIVALHPGSSATGATKAAGTARATGMTRITGLASFIAAYEAEHSPLDMGPQESVVRPQAAVPYVPSAALVVRRAAVGAGFDADMRVGEDVDLVWRLAADGHRVRYEPAATVRHEHRTRPGDWFSRRVDYGSSAAPLALRHPGRLPAVSMSGWSALAWGLTLTRHPVAGAVVAAGSTAALARKFSAWNDRPWPLATRLAGGGTLMAGELLGRTLLRAWLPLALPVAAAVPRLRLPLAAAAVAPAVLAYRRSGSDSGLGAVPWVTLKLLDDAAYGLGVWRGCLHERTAAPLRGRLWWISDDGVSAKGQGRRLRLGGGTKEDPDRPAHP
ncbi:mycofactocin biosynthesis glycosyltransferase MftF [Streptomyces sp. NPDC048254]|uniref:mycofactocin biosynthesis glycosyltransferase MftF n=1 Tax=Streptomyces sp. NPDC048254 TaxID=3365525 RepID=UPI00371E0C87